MLFINRTTGAIIEQNGRGTLAPFWELLNPNKVTYSDSEVIIPEEPEGTQEPTEEPEPEQVEESPEQAPEDAEESPEDIQENPEADEGEAIEDSEGPKVWNTLRELKASAPTDAPATTKAGAVYEYDGTKWVKK